MLGPAERRANARWNDSTVSKLSPSRLPAVAPGGRLAIVFPRALAAGFRVEGDRVVFGRHGDHRVVHPTVSRAHLAITWSTEAGKYLAQDLDSHNGSALDGIVLESQPRALGDGSVLRLGEVLAVWEQGGEPDGGDRGAGSVATDALPGQAARMVALREAIGRAAADPAPVLIVGETGSGKERVARELHRLSGRTGALVSINCAALQPSLVESELFGHSRGAFTGAHEAQRGLFREANGGSLFLDEIGELPLALQAKLLRAIQEREVQPVGVADPVAVDVRVLAATHRKPSEAIAAGFLREDLYARLSLWELHVPPLRARRIDLHDWLVRIHRAWRPTGTLPPLSTDTMETLLLQRWPLNLRAVERLVRDLAARPPDRMVERRDLPRWLDAVGAATPPDACVSTLTAPALEARRPLPSPDEFATAFEQLGGNVCALARHFGRERRQIYRWIEAYGKRGAR